MQDKRLIPDLIDANHPPEAIEKLSAQNITTYSRLFAVLHEETAAPAVRIDACWTIFALWQSIDRRCVVPALLAALPTTHADLRQTVIRTLGHLRAHRAVKPLMTITQDRTEDVQTRYFAVEALGTIRDERARLVIQRLAFDQTESVYVRSAAIEWGYSLLDDDPQPTHFIRLLSDPVPDIRFWAAFALANLAGHGRDISPAWSILDQVAAFDHTLPEYWGWQVGREALEPLEMIHFQPYRQFYVDEHNDRVEHSWETYLISPAPEYDRYLHLYRQYREDRRYTTEPAPPVTLSHSVEGLKSQLQAHWQLLSFDLRSDSQTYSLSWLTQIEGFNLLGGLHRDGYAVVLTGNMEAVFRFALWYRNLIADCDLYLYQWASPGVRLDYNMTLTDIRQGINNQYERFHQELRSSI